MPPSFGVAHYGCFAAHIPSDLDVVDLPDFAWGCVHWVGWSGRTHYCLDREFVNRGHFGTNFAGRHFGPQLGSFCAAWTGLRYGFLLRMCQYRLEPCWDRDSLWSWHCSHNSGCRFVCDDYRLHLHCNRQAFWQFGFIRAMVLPNWKLLSPEGKYALVLFSRLCLSLFLEAVASTNSIAVIDGSQIYSCALRTRVISQGCVSLSFWRLWPLQIQLQWLTGVTLTDVRLNYITCNFFW